jgi:orotate phosphoribosyltransferase
MISQTSQNLATQLFDIGAIKFGAFRLKLHQRTPEAPLSPIYIDLRILRSFPEVMASTVDMFSQLIGDLRFDLIADVPTSATPIAAILSYLLKVPMVSPRKDVKDHGTGNRIEGVFQHGQVVLLIDDLITTADSMFEAIAVLTKNGLLVHDTVVLVDRQQGGVEQLATQGYICHTAFRLKDLLEFYYAAGKVSQTEYERTVEYLTKSALRQS